MERRDSRIRYDSFMEEYLSDYGFHFNKKLFEFATKGMKDRNGQKLKIWDKDASERFLTDYGVTILNDVGHDVAYVLNMARSDYFGSSIPDEQRLALFAKDYLDDPDGAESRAFDEYYIKTVALGIPIFWDEML